MLRFSPMQRLRQRLARLPGAARLWDLARLTLTPRYREDGLATVHNCDFAAEPRFLRAYARALRQEPGVAIRWRAHVVQWAGAQAMRLDGDLVECGVNRAFLSASLMEYVDFDRNAGGRRFYLFDTYDGLVPELVGPEDHAAWRHPYPDCYAFVRESFRDSPNVVIVRGPVPDTLATVAIDRVAYLSIDMNATPPEVAALEHFWPKLVPGAVVLLDDYGFPGHEAQKAGADDFARHAGTQVLTLPTGQGLIVRT